MSFWILLLNLLKQFVISTIPELSYTNRFDFGEIGRFIRVLAQLVCGDFGVNRFDQYYS